MKRLILPVIAASALIFGFISAEWGGGRADDGQGPRGNVDARFHHA
jgi:hypothetical protein